MAWIALFSLGIAFVVYILFGYPALLYILAKRRGRPVRQEPSIRSVSMLIAVHNGEPFVESKLRSIFELHYPADEIEIIVACDGCTDATAEMARQVGGDRVQVLQLPRAGKAVALNEAMKAARGEIFVFTDIRQRLDPDCLRYLMESFADPQVGAVSARLVILKGSSQGEENVGLYWRYEFWVRSQLSRLDSIFGATGACYAMRRELTVPIPPGTLLDDMYEPLGAFFRGYRLIADERALIFDYPTNPSVEFDRKVRTLAGNYQILAAYPRLLGPGNRLWFHYVSYKFGRLLLPIALMLILAASFGLPAPWWMAAMGGQVLLYFLALVDPVTPASLPFKRITSILHTFAVLMVATIYASRILFRRSSADLWKQRRVSQPKG
ncbi:MAG TPA: glycosyltransferase family 2 protein [Bryobacteraceae bacterium]|nr:glycosyltransferase family 2 protein [Bryobacteraceae bacterium]